MKDEHLIPEVIKNIAATAKTAKGNEKFMAEARLRAIIEYCQKVLKN